LTFYLAVYLKRMAQGYDEITELSRDSSIDAKERDSRIEAIKAGQSLAGRLLKIPIWIIQQYNEGQRKGEPIALGKVNNKALANNSETQEVTSASSLNELEDDIDYEDDEDDDEEGEPKVFTADLLNNDNIENSEEVKSTTPGSIGPDGEATPTMSAIDGNLHGYSEQEISDTFAMRWINGVMTKIDLTDVIRKAYEKGKL
jgi:hypothetical protein